MPLQLVRDAIEKARAREPIVHAMALLSGSKLLAYMDLPAAAYAFAEGVKELGRVPLDGHIRNSLHYYAIQQGIPASPELAVDLFRTSDFSQEFHVDSTSLLYGLLQHGQFALALELLEDLRYPVQPTDGLFRAAPDAAAKRRILHAGMARWRMPKPGMHDMRIDQFYGLFARYHHLLPPALATSWLDEMLDRVLAMEDIQISARYGDDVHFTTFREAYLFELLCALYPLKPAAFVDALLRQFPAVAAGARIYPLGLESLMAQAAPPNPRPPTAFPPRYPDILHLLNEAHPIYLEDLQSNNAAPRVFWPSAAAYCLALHHAGQQLGMAGTKYLDQIPDTDLVIRASFELAAGVLGLAYQSGPRIFLPAQS